MGKDALDRLVKGQFQVRHLILWGPFSWCLKQVCKVQFKMGNSVQSVWVLAGINGSDGLRLVIVHNLKRIWWYTSARGLVKNSRLKNAWKPVIDHTSAFWFIVVPLRLIFKSVVTKVNVVYPHATCTRNECVLLILLDSTKLAATTDIGATESTIVSLDLRWT